MFDEPIVQLGVQMACSGLRVAGLWWAVFRTALPNTPPVLRVAVIVAASGLSAMSPLSSSPVSASKLVAEAALGLALGWATAIFLDAFQVGAQAVALQAGFAYANSIDPSSQADSGLLPTLARGLTLLVFFGSGLDREVIRVIAAANTPELGLAGGVTVGSVSLALATVFGMSLRLALPLITLLVVSDLGLALLNRAFQQLQLSAVSFVPKLAIWPLAGIVSLPAAIWLLNRLNAEYLGWIRIALGVP